MQAIPIAKCYLPYTVLRVEMILESYAKVYFNQFSTGIALIPASAMQYSAQQEKTCKYVNYSLSNHCNVTGLLRLLQVNIQGPVARSLVSANRWLRGIKMYRFPWYLTLVSTNHALSNPSQVFKIIK